ncbi:universal stress protein [Sphingomonas aerophila]|uniref:Nucleotide-binding universal stress UspA family protein n=1 Tax=Sphingomonas aerophila TaxID=1344948 RepID=A0A7W9BCH9_9SPHN|nr:universal stress protein [Sphingomonas aerophila]MBB5714493.1 nucleotide-binding universal stress UspA family protein [Sphingomonas aerophila]
MKNILLLAHADNGQFARLQASLALVRALDGHLTCLDLAIVPERMTDYVAHGSGTLLLLDEQRQESQHAARLRAQLETEKVPFDFVETVGFVTQTIEAHAVLADLIVVSTTLREGFPDMERITADLLAWGQRPVLAVPEVSGPFEAQGGNVLVAWDGSPDAEAALGAAIPLLQRAGKVTIAVAEDGSVQLPPEDAALYLSRHGIVPIVEKVRTGGNRASVVLEDLIGHMKPAFVVMGGFSRTRTSETLFGGVSHRLMTHSKVPLFMAHRP